MPGSGYETRKIQSWIWNKSFWIRKKVKDILFLYIFLVFVVACKQCCLWCLLLFIILVSSCCLPGIIHGVERCLESLTHDDSSWQVGSSSLAPRLNPQLCIEWFANFCKVHTDIFFFCWLGISFFRIERYPDNAESSIMQSWTALFFVFIGFIHSFITYPHGIRYSTVLKYCVHTGNRKS